MGATRRRAVVLGSVLLIVAASAGCRDGGDDAVPAAPSSAPTSVPAADPAPTTTAAPAETAAPETTGAAATEPPVTAEPPPTGVPGLSSDDAFCRDYARVLGTSNLLTISGAFGAQTVEELARVEAIAAPAVAEAAAIIGDEVPESAAADADVLVRDVVGPVAARAARVVDALRSAGLDDVALTDLVARWDEVLETDDQGDPAVSVDPLDADTEAAIAAALVTLDLVPYHQDTTLFVPGASTPLVFAHVQQSCPEILGLLGDAD